MERRAHHAGAPSARLLGERGHVQLPHRLAVRLREDLALRHLEEHDPPAPDWTRRTVSSGIVPDQSRIGASIRICWPATSMARARAWATAAGSVRMLEAGPGPSRSAPRGVSRPGSDRPGTNVRTRCRRTWPRRLIDTNGCTSIRSVTCSRISRPRPWERQKAGRSRKAITSTRISGASKAQGSDPGASAGDGPSRRAEKPMPGRPRIRAPAHRRPLGCWSASGRVTQPQ